LIVILLELATSPLQWPCQRFLTEFEGKLKKG